MRSAGEPGEDKIMKYCERGEKGFKIDRYCDPNSNNDVLTCVDRKTRTVKIIQKSTTI